MNEVEAHTPNRPWSKRVPEGRTPKGGWDAIVIGSGIGGMTTAGVLTKTGKKVLVLEQHYVPGGYTHAFRRKGYHWDVGVHLVGATSPITLTGRVLSALAGGRLEWADVGATYDEFRFPDGFQLAFPDNPKAFRAELQRAFPDQGEVIDRYLSEVRSAAHSLRGYFISRALGTGPIGRLLGGFVSREAMKNLSTPAAEVMERLVPDEKLRALLLAQWGYHGSPPSEVAWGLQALIVQHFLYGATYPKGGAGEIARHMLQEVADGGGWTRICADVDQIVVEKGRAVGVKMADGEVIRAKRIVSATNVSITANRLLPPELRSEGWVERVGHHKPGPAHVCLYLGFKGDVKAAGGSAASQWYYQTWSHEQATWPIHPDQPVERPPVLFTSFPSLKDPLHDPGPEQRHTGEMITFVDWEVFDRWKGTAWRKRGDDYEAFKAQLTEKMLEVLWEQNPGLKPLLDHHELATPLSTDFFCKPVNGSIYGLAHTPERFADPWLKCKSPLPGLFLSGSDVSSCGVMGAFMGGLLCGIAMEPARALSWLRPLASKR